MEKEVPTSMVSIDTGHKIGNPKLLLFVIENTLTFLVILSIEDELEYWKSITEKKDSNKKEQEAASTFCELFEDVVEEIR